MTAANNSKITSTTNCFNTGGQNSKDDNNKILAKGVNEKEEQGEDEDEEEDIVEIFYFATEC